MYTPLGWDLSWPVSWNKIWIHHIYGKAWKNQSHLSGIDTVVVVPQLFFCFVLFFCMYNFTDTILVLNWEQHERKKEEMFAAGKSWREKGAQEKDGTNGKLCSKTPCLQLLKPWGHLELVQSCAVLPFPWLKAVLGERETLPGEKGAPFTPTLCLWKCCTEFPWCKLHLIIWLLCNTAIPIDNTQPTWNISLLLTTSTQKLSRNSSLNDGDV